MKMNLKDALISKSNGLAKFFNRVQKYTVATVSGEKCAAESFDTVEQACQTNLESLGELMQSWVTEKPTSDLEIAVTLKTGSQNETVTVRFPAPQKFLASQAVAG